MTETAKKGKTYVLDFNYDENDTSAVTVLINDVRFHITVDPADLQKRDKPIYYEYLDKVSSLREAEEREEEAVEKAQIAGNKKAKKERSQDRDSAVDVSADDEYAEESEEGEDADQDSASAQVELRNWILDTFTDVVKEWAPPNREPVSSTLHEWYHGPTYFYSMQIKSGKLEPELIDTSDDLTAKIDALVPKLHMPKYIQDIDAPWLCAHDLIVEAEVTSPEPAHPGLVTSKATGEKYFFKPVVPSQPGLVKREISILQKLGRLDLDIKVPRLLGFVSASESKASKTEATGMLLTPIDSPRPLTTLLSTSVPEQQRKEWASKCETYVKALHSHAIIWGDAKADNFMVDADNELWIIDFGGSYTEGWVDPELSETKEGDRMGLKKVVQALEDPQKNTFDPVIRETASSLFVTERVEEGGKRKRDGDDQEEDVKDTKRRKEDGAGDDGEDDEEYVEKSSAEV
ncbi:hypothetical protein EK21DRAFT_61684 [Setomelanomma holmii]|uniref:Protein kinase domain-containing protein n=1 Tax=Setomelanomma holmii TaxID=210430 RepID=A0A9P4HCF1_9PLEO|nr:hypothetical protein EK21DRAFT_61684 [Setomelanomma holmii]